MTAVPGLAAIRSRERARALIARASETILGGRAILSNRYVAAKVLPLGAESGHSIQVRSSRTAGEADLPAPPDDLWQRWGGDLDWYLASGRGDVETMLRVLAEAGAPRESFTRVLDFGCAEGRMLRFFPTRDASELWGVDVNAERIAWAQEQLGPERRFVTVTTAPHLPFEDGSFDLVYALSVFTHIAELADAWFLELMRVLRPGGHAYLTVQDEHSVELLLGRDRRTHAYLSELLQRFDRETGVLSQDWTSFAIYADPGSHVFHRSERLVRRWSQYADLARLEREVAHYQSAVVFRKRSPTR